MKKSNMDIIVGGSILLAIFILVFGVLWLKESLVAKQMESYTILFPNVGTLQLGDPVMTNGVTKGRVPWPRSWRSWGCEKRMFRHVYDVPRLR